MSNIVNSANIEAKLEAIQYLAILSKTEVRSGNSRFANSYLRRLSELVRELEQMTEQR